MLEENEWTTRKKLIDKALLDAGWGPIVDFVRSARYISGAVREYPTAEGPADYVLFRAGKAVAAVEAKRRKLGPQNVLGQAQRYASGFNDGEFEFREFHLPFIYSTNGDAIWFQDLREQNSRSRQIAKFHTPQALAELLATDIGAGFEWLAKTPNDNPFLRQYQRDAIESIEKSLTAGKRRMLLAMATGTGKTFVAISQIYRFLKSKTAKRILFLVDRRALAAQAVGAFAAFEPEPGLKFDKIYEVYTQFLRKEDLPDDYRDFYYTYTLRGKDVKNTLALKWRLPWTAPTVTEP